MRFGHWIQAGMILIAATISGGCTMISNGAPNRPKTIQEFMRLDARPRVIAHRGFSGEAPENTMAAFRKAVEVKADMMELDVLLSKDGQVVVIHDDTLERTTNGLGYVADTNYEELARLDAGTWFHPEFEGETIPLLRDVLLFAKGRILVNIEIKTEAWSPNTFEGIAAKVISLVDELGMRDRVIISSFDSRILKQVRQLDSEIKTATLYNEDARGDLRPLVLVADDHSNGFNLSKSEVSSRVVEDCHSQGIPVSVYTVNTAEMMDFILRMGVDAIFTDQPDVMIKLIKENTYPRGKAPKKQDNSESVDLNYGM